MVEKRNTQRDLDWHKDVYRLSKAGYSIRDIAIKHNVSSARITNSLTKYTSFFYSIYDRGISPISFSSKREPYYKTEEEMFFDFKYTFEQLSESEKEIWNNFK